MKKKTIWTIELPSNTTSHSLVRSTICGLGCKIVSAKEEYEPITDEECRFWLKKLLTLPDTNFYAVDNEHKIIYAFNCRAGKLKVGSAKCHNKDTFKPAFGRALAKARCFGDRKLERALLHFTPEQINKFF